MPPFQLLEQTRATFGLQKRHKLVMGRYKLRLILAYVKVEAHVRSQPIRQIDNFVLIQEEGAGLTSHFGKEMGTRQA